MVDWNERSKKQLKDSINRRIRSIIGVSLESIEDNIADRDRFNDVRFVVMKVCNDIARKIELDLDGYTVSRNRFTYNMPYKEEEV